MFRFTIRDVLWLTVVVAVSLAGLRAFLAYSDADYQNFHLRVTVNGQDKMIQRLTEVNSRLKRSQQPEGSNNDTSQGR